MEGGQGDTQRSSPSAGHSNLRLIIKSAPAFTARLNIDVEDALASLCSGHGGAPILAIVKGPKWAHLGRSSHVIDRLQSEAQQSFDGCQIRSKLEFYVCMSNRIFYT